MYMLARVFQALAERRPSVYSRFAKKRTDVGKATIMGFIIVTSLMLLVALLPYAVLRRADIAGMRQPSVAAVLESVFVDLWVTSAIIQLIVITTYWSREAFSLMLNLTGPRRGRPSPRLTQLPLALHPRYQDDCR